MPIHRTPRLRRFLTYDMEWKPGSMELRVIGVYDGQSYRRYLSVADFLDGEFTSKNRGAWFYAHAGGLADVQFLLRELRNRPHFHCRGSFSGSSLIILRVSSGKNSWTLVDSYWTLKSPLKDIATSIGMEKGGPDEDEGPEWYASVDFETLEAYNRTDCVILWKALHEFECALLDLGGELMPTLASCSMRLFRRKYLTRKIDTSRSVNEIARQSYFSSRVEVFRRHAWRGARYYDVNSSFPYAMTFPLPGAAIGIGTRLPDDPERLYIASLRVTVPDRYLTSTPFRFKERVFFPSGTWDAVLTSIDVGELLLDGGKIEKVYEVWIFESFNDLAEFARDIYARRMKTTDPMERLVYKLVPNSVYGKFAENRHKQVMHINPSLEVLSRLSFENQLIPGVFFEDKEMPIPHEHVPVSTFIVSIGRKVLTGHLRKSDTGDRHTSRFYYCDTDGFCTTRRYPTGKELGELKLEKRLERHGVFVAPKLYRLDDKVKAKGFSLGKDPKVALERFNALIRYETIEVERMIRIRENLRAGNVDPKQSTVIKRLSQKTIPKRYTYRDGTTRPWTVKELIGRL